MKYTFPKINPIILLVIGLFLGFVFRVYNLNYSGLWNDELFTAFTADPKKSISEIMDILKTDIHPPLHNFLSYYWCQLFGYNDSSLRMINVLFGSLGVLSVYHLGSILFNKKIGLYALLFAIVNAYLIEYSQEVRAYSLFFLLANYSYYYFILLLQKRLSYLRVFLYILISISLIYTHYFGVFIILSQVTIFLVNWARTRIDKPKLWIISILFTPIVALIFWLPIIINRLGRDIDNWRDAPGFKTIYNYFTLFFGDYVLGTIVFILFLTTIIIVVYHFIRKQAKLVNPIFKDIDQLIILTIWVTSYFLIPIIVSLFYNSMMVDRYFISVLAPLILILSFYINRIPNDKIKYVCLFALLIYSCAMPLTKDRPYFVKTTMYRESVHHLMKINPKPYVLYQSRAKYEFLYYLKQYDFSNRIGARAYIDQFEKVVRYNNPIHLYVLLDLRAIPESYSDSLPVFDNYDIVGRNTFKNSYNVEVVSLIHFKKKNQIIKE